MRWPIFLWFAFWRLGHLRQFRHLAIPARRLTFANVYGLTLSRRHVSLCFVIARAILSSGKLLCRTFLFWCPTRTGVVLIRRAFEISLVPERKLVHAGSHGGRGSDGDREDNERKEEMRCFESEYAPSALDSTHGKSLARIRHVESSTVNNAKSRRVRRGGSYEPNTT